MRVIASVSALEAAPEIAPVAVFAIGNRSRGDDAVAPLLLDRLRDWLEAEGLAADFELFEEYQLQVENAFDLPGRRLALFIDAVGDAPGPVAFAPVAVGGERSAHASHALEPAAVLRVYGQVIGDRAPPSYVVGVRGSCFDLGAEPSEQARAAMEEAWALLRVLCRSPDHAEWQTMATVARAPRALPDAIAP